eukprot:CAMPEP_0113660458 /NCGR_PEP_ID=MMETSP0017_2-20120614/32911_1 /TAXON_ID=2856 /ORGANISM="Cylindrotheca closterium" /LENGTH=1135 /DNA_ID=CAMNT_0000575095 /DNA_START=78 /DNA_END=3481 /DNA_ORIENTATION=+ /assembly_acc=CAM_ASM_000147
MESQTTPNLPVSPKSPDAVGVLRPSNSNTSSNNTSSNKPTTTTGVISPNFGPSPLILKDPLIIDIDTKTLQQPPLAHPFGAAAAKIASTSSREGLKRQVERRRMTLTVPERNFLDHLCVHGNEVEVQLAYERLGDEDLFFDWQTPRYLKASENQAPEDEPAFFSGDNTASGTGTADGVTAATAASAGQDSATDGNISNVQRPTMQRRVSVGSQRRVQILEDRKSHKSALWQAHESGIAVTHAASKKSIFKRTSSTVSILSNGSAVAPQMVRDSSRFSFASTNTAASTSGDGEAVRPTMEIFRRVENNNSNANKMRAASPLRKARYQRSQSLTIPGSSRDCNVHQIPSPRGFQQRRLSTSSRKSVTFSSQTPPTSMATRSKSVTLRRSNSDGMALNKMDSAASSTKPPRSSGRPPLAQRSESMASIPSIHHAAPLRSESIGSIPSIHHANAVRGDSVASSRMGHGNAMRSNSISSIPSIRHGTALRSGSISSIPSIRHGTALRSDSIGSIPSIHHAHAIRGESVSTIPSIHPANALRGESVSTIPSIHPANALRGESVSTIPSIHPANAMRGESISTIPSIHHANAMRGESVSTIPSIHHANAVRSDSASTAMPPPLPHQLQIVTDRDYVVSGTFPTGMVNLEALDHSLMDDEDDNVDDPLSPGSLQSKRKKKVLDHQNSLLVSAPQLGEQQQQQQQQLLPTYSATPDIASAWLNQQQGHFQSKPFELQSPGGSSFPPAIQIPSTITDKTSLSTKSSDDQAAFMVNKKAVLVRRASRNSQYDGEGMEVTEMPEMDYEEYEPYWQSSMNMMSIRQCTSFDDETMSLYSNRQNNFDEVFRRSIRRTFSDEEVAAANMLVGNGSNVMFRQISQMTISKREGGVETDDSDDDDASWDLQSRSGDARYDSWNIVKDEYVNGYGGGGTLDFMILGTCADDISAAPHVLSPPMMESLAAFLPYAQSSENFLLRYSLVRDGASMLTFLKRSRGVQYGILAMETVDGEVFGCFTGQPWRKSPSYFGTGESFLWKMRRSRLEATNDILEQAQLESEIDVYPHTGDNQYFQLCTHDRIAVGGGTPSGEKKTSDPPIDAHEWGFGLDIQGDLLVGSSSPCATFDSPSLSKVHPDGSLFEIVNLELWAL